MADNLYDDEFYDDEFYDGEGADIDSKEAEEQLEELNEDMFTHYINKEKEKYENADIKEPEQYQDRVDYGENRWRNGRIGFFHGVILGFLARIREMFSVLIFGDKNGIFRGTKNELERHKRAEEFKKSEPEKEKKDDENKEVKETQKNMDKTERKISEKDIKGVLDDKGVVEIFKNQGILVEKGSETTMIISLENGEKFEMDLIEGMDNNDVKVLAEAIYSLENTKLEDTANEIDALKVDAALKSSLIIAGMNGIERDIYFTMEYKNIDIYTLAKTTIATEDGLSKLEIKAFKDNDNVSKTSELMTQILYNGKEIAKVPIEQVINPESFSADINKSIYVQINNTYKESKSSTLEIGKGDKTISFNKENEGVHIYLNDKRGEGKDLGIFKIETEKDISNITKVLEENGWKNNYSKNVTVPGRLNANTIAYTIGVITNPTMVSSISKEQKYYEPLSGNYKEAGSSHFNIAIDNGNICIQKNIPTQSNDGIRISTENVASFHSIGELANNMQQINSIACKIQDAFINEIEKNDLTADMDNRIAENIDMSMEFNNNYMDKLIEKEFNIDHEVDISHFTDTNEKNDGFYIENNEEFVQNYIDNIEVVDEIDFQDEEIDI